MKIIDLLINSAESKPDRIAMKSGNMEVTYAQMLSDVHTLSEQLKLAGCSEGAKVAIVLGNSIEYLISFFAVSAASGIILPLSRRMTPHEISGYINKSDVSIVITDKKYAKRLFGNITVIYVRYDVRRNLEVELNTLKNCSIDEQNSDVALFVLTSGTLSLPKIVMLTNENLISNMVTYRSLMGFAGHNVVYCALSFHHIYCVCAQILTHISLADTFIVNEAPFFIRDFLTAIDEHNVTITAFVPYMATLLSEYPESYAFNLDSLKYVTLSGAKTPKSTYEILANRHKTTQFINTYGMSEAGSRISIAAPFPRRFPAESVGRPMLGVEVKIVDEKGQAVVENSLGEIFVKGSGVMKGYYKQPDLTAQTLVDGWLKTGDLGRIDEAGNLFILGRKKETIISGGENLCPSEIEECLTQHPAIREAAVVGQKHKLLQEVPCAFVVKNNSSEELTPIDIVEYCRNKLSSQKIPKSIEFLPTLPKVGTSKVDRNALREMADSLK
jgi:acyl-CoA synthetase (AMP-forming)/AMP-acid ligase II